MSTYKYLNKINKSGKKLFLTRDIRDLLEVKSINTVEDIIKRLLLEGILISVEKGKYMLADAVVSDYEVSQFLYSPSYISFETALNYHGVLSQFPTEITSATTKSPVQKQFQGKLYTYSKIHLNLFTGYFKEGDSLIANPEKALFDQLYMISKGLKTNQYLDELDYSVIDKTKLKGYLNLISVKLQSNVDELINKYL